MERSGTSSGINLCSVIEAKLLHLQMWQGILETPCLSVEMEIWYPMRTELVDAICHSLGRIARDYRGVLLNHYPKVEVWSVPSLLKSSCQIFGFTRPED